VRLVSAGPRLRITILLLSSSAANAFGQVQQSALTASLKGTEAVSIVTIGDTGTPAGVSGVLPVNTLGYPDGQVIYRVEFGLVRGEVARMQKSFGNGTTFQISDVDFKDDRLELKLVGRNRDAGRLKLMLGAGWQTRMSNEAVIVVVEKFLSLPSVSTNTLPQSSPSFSPVHNAVRLSTLPKYHRPGDTATVPGRLSEEQLQIILLGLDQESQSADDEVRRASTFLSQALRSFEAVYSDPRQRSQALIQPIVELQGRLGPDLVPGTLDDASIMNAVYDKCSRVARMRQAGDQNGREYGPGANSPGYMQAFLSRDSVDAHSRSNKELRDALINKSVILGGDGALLRTEQALDRGDLRRANESFDMLSKSPAVRISEVSQYLNLTADLRGDLAAYSEAINSTSDTDSPPIQLIHEIATEETQLAATGSKPITSSYLRQRINSEKAVLKDRLTAVPAFHFEPKLYQAALRPRSTMPANDVNDATAAQAAEIKNLLLSSSQLIALVEDPKALELTRSWYGESMFVSLTAKGKDIPAAQALENRLDEQAATEQRLRDQEQERKQALTNERNSLASEIVNATLIITKLDEQFKQTEVMGYSMEASKQRTKLANLLRSDRLLLDRSVWDEVDASFQRILPGLTVWEANHAQSILADIRR
jgi:hypothetical protein